MGFETGSTKTNDNNFDDLFNYSLSPKQIGTWIDGTPVWRVAIYQLVDGKDIHDLCDDGSVPVPISCIRREGDAFVLNYYLALAGEDYPNMLDDACAESYTSNTAFFGNGGKSMAKNSPYDYFHVIGWIEFVTNNDNIK